MKETPLLCFFLIFLLPLASFEKNQERMWTNPGEIPDNGIDDDGNSLMNLGRGHGSHGPENMDVQTWWFREKAVCYILHDFPLFLLCAFLLLTFALNDTFVSLDGTSVSIGQSLAWRIDGHNGTIPVYPCKLCHCCLGNGIIDDVYGADFANDDGDPFDDQMHGTHCAGTIAGSIGSRDETWGSDLRIRAWWVLYRRLVILVSNIHL